ncbi:hypothetical protein FXO38_05280 [Capsicum annuum]|nr:hypothetical protein FXO38_05280 [Capsicum annuum]
MLTNESLTPPSWNWSKNSSTTPSLTAPSSKNSTLSSSHLTDVDMTDGNAKEHTHSSKPIRATSESHNTHSIEQLPSIECSGHGKSHDTINYDGLATPNVHNSTIIDGPPAIIMAGDGSSRASGSSKLGMARSQTLNCYPEPALSCTTDNGGNDPRSPQLRPQHMDDNFAKAAQSDTNGDPHTRIYK